MEREGIYILGPKLMNEAFMAEIRWVIFDWGGVLVDDPGPPMARYCSEVLGVLESDYVEAVRRYAGDFRKGLIEEGTFWRQVCGFLGAAPPKDGSLWGTALAAVYRPKTEMFELVRKLRGSGFGTALLSNTEMPGVEYYRRQGYDLFDEVVFSCVERMKKPQREIYELTLERLGCAGGEAVFIDDHELCVEAAKAVGLNTIFFKSAGQVKEELGLFGVGTD